MPQPPEETHYNPSIDSLKDASIGDGIHIQSGSVDFNGVITKFEEQDEHRLTVIVDNGTKVCKYRATDYHRRFWAIQNDTPT